MGTGRTSDEGTLADRNAAPFLPRSMCIGIIYRAARKRLARGRD